MEKLPLKKCEGATSSELVEHFMQQYRFKIAVVCQTVATEYLKKSKQICRGEWVDCLVASVISCLN